MITFVDALLRLGAALFLGALIGLERESDEQSAGVRTNALVSLGCALFTIISAYGFLSFTNLSHVQVDPTRIASYIVAGIGFLGGGTIFIQKDPQKVKGLTTAAAIWVVAAIGMACGAGMYREAILVTVLVLIVLFILRFVINRFLGDETKSQRLEIELQSANADQCIAMLYDVCERHNVKMKNLKVHVQHDVNKIILTCHVNRATSLIPVINAIRSYEGVRTVDIAL